MNPYHSMESARRAAQARLTQAAGGEDRAYDDWLDEARGGSLDAQGATVANGRFWRALMAARDPGPILLRAADLFLAEGRPGWARALIFFAGLSGVDPEVRERLGEAEAAEADPDKSIEEGVALHDKGRFADAIEVYDQVVARHPGGARARYEKALSLATLTGQAADEEVRALCREAQRSDPFYGAAWVTGEQARVFATAVAPAVYGATRDRSALKRLAHGLQELGLPELAALAWMRLLRQEPLDVEVRGPLTRCLDAIGAGEVLDGPRLPAALSPAAADGVGDEAELRRAVCSLRESTESAYRDGRQDIGRATRLLEMATRLGPDDLEVALAHNLLAAMYQNDARPGRAESHLRQALMILEATALPDDPNLVRVMHNLAAVLMDQGRLPEARRLLRQGLDAVRDPAHRSTLLATLAGAELRLGDLDQAKKLTEEAAATAGDAPGAGERRAWVLLGLRADIARASGDHAGAVGYLEELLSSQAEALGAEDPRLAVTKRNLAAACAAQGSRQRAEALLRESLELRRRAQGASHPDLATAEHDLGLLLAQDNRLDEARAHLSTALEVRQAGLPEDDPSIPATLVDLAQIETLLNARGQALRHLAEALELDIRLLHRLAEGMTPFERSVLLARVGQRLGVTIWTALSHDADPEAQRLAARCVLARKGDPERAAVPHAPEYRPAVRAFASLLLGGPRDRSAVDYRLALHQAEERIEELSQAEPATTAGSTAGDRLTEVQAALGERVLLEYVRIEPPRVGPGPGEQTARYAVLVLGASVLAVVRLGPCARVDRLVRRFRETMDQAPAWVTGNERAAEARLRVTSQALYAELVAPVRDLLRSATSVLVAPDGDLHLVPFGVLVAPDGRYLVEDSQLVVVASGNDVLREPSWPNLDGDTCVFVDPDFELEPAHAAPEPGPLHYSRVSQYLAGASWTRLERTQEEARAVVEALPGETVRVFSGAQASEASLFSLHSPRILHISTHGFFLDEEELPPLPPAGERRFEVGVPPMLRSGLALAGAGTIGRRSVSGLTDKGLLTALEVATLDLSGTEVVVLSGCETAVGSPLPGEGVLGLRRAFQQAGAGKLVSSLWKVPEAESAALLGRFYRHIGEGDDPAAALRAACLEMLAERRATGAAAHPLFWGGFIAIGIPRALPGLDASLPTEDGQRLELALLDDVRVTATAHTLDAGGPLPVVTLVTRGLARTGAGELALTVLREPAPSARRLLAMLGSAVAAARAGHPPVTGDLLPVRGGANGLLGFCQFERALLWHPHALAAVPETNEALTVQLLTAQEARHLDQLGPLRLMARLGHAAGFYPSAPWVDPNRKPLIDDGEVEHSVLARCRSLRLPGTRISRISRAGRDGLSIEVGREHGQDLEDILNRDDLPGVSLLGHEDPEADAIMVWHSGAPPTAIVPGRSRASRFALNFVLMLRGDDDRLGWVEDGATWVLSPQAWTRLRKAVAGREMLNTAVGESPVRWAWVAAGEPDGPARLEAVQLITPNERAEQAVTFGEAAGVVRRAERAVREATRGTSRDPRQLVVQLTLLRDGGLRVRYRSAEPEPEDLYRAVNGALQRQSWPMLPGDDFELAMQFRLWEPAGGAGDVRVRMTIWSEVDTDILLDGEHVTAVDHATGFDYATAHVTVTPSSRLTFKGRGFEISCPVSRFVDPRERTLEARVGTGRDCDVVISDEQKRAAMGTSADLPRLTEDLLTHVRPSVRYDAANRLGHIGDRSAVPALLEALRSDPDPYVQACVAEALGRIGDVSVAPAVQQAFDAYERKDSYGYMFEAALRDLELLRRREQRRAGPPSSP